jgi:magnesium transporter
MPIVDNAIYVGGVRDATAHSLEETFETLHERGGMAWIGLYRPTPEEIRAVAEEFELHHLAVEDALHGHQRPKLERYGETLFVVLRPARYLDAPEEVEFGELHLFVGRNFAVTIRHAESPDLGRVRKRLEQNPALLALGTESILYAAIDQVVDEYLPVVNGLQNDIDEIEDQLFGGDQAVSRRIYELLREVIEFQRATRPLVDVVAGLESGFQKYSVDLELQRNLRDVADHLQRVVERADAFRVLLQNALTLHSTIVAQAQNDEMRRLSESSLKQNDEVKKISAWAAILFAPTLVGTVYGMNFEYMPELDWLLGYPFAIALMLAMGFGLYVVFRRRGWL